MPTRNNTGSQSSTAETSKGLEENLVQFAEGLGWLVGTVQAKAEGWMDRNALRQRIAQIRDDAAKLLTHLSNDEPAKTARPSKGRSGGVVDASGKRHRKPMPTTRGVKHSDQRVAKIKAADTTRHRRG